MSPGLVALPPGMFSVARDEADDVERQLQQRGGVHLEAVAPAHVARLVGEVRGRAEIARQVAEILGELDALGNGRRLAPRRRPGAGVLPRRPQRRSRLPLRAPVGRSGRPETSRQSYSIDAVNEFDPLFEDVYAYCEEMALNVDTLIHETGAGQMEINFFHDHPLALADEVFFFKRTLREAALRHDMHATFMAKPIAGEPGSAMHIHQSVVEKGSGRNIFSNPTARRAASSAGTSAACNATRRPRPPCSRRTSKLPAPHPLHGSADQHPVGHRQPHGRDPFAGCRTASRRVENRVIGADANPYIAMAATLACGWLGIQQRIEPGPECVGNAYLGDYALPRSLGEALEALRGETDLRDILGPEFVTVYTEVKEIEHDEFMKVISPWEREHLLLHV